MRLHPRVPRRTDRTRPACTLCLDERRVPYVGNHFDMWMVPCHACTGHPADAGSRGARRARTTAASHAGTSLSV